MLLKIILTVSVFLMSSGFCVAKTFVLNSHDMKLSLVQGKGRLVETNVSLKQADVNDLISFTTESGTEYSFPITRKQLHFNGDVTFVGYFDGVQEASVLTVGQAGSSALLNTSEGAYKIKTTEGREWLQSPSMISKSQPMPFIDDAMTPPDSLVVSPDSSKSIPKDNGSESVAHIDVMVLYTQELINRMGSVAAVETRINQLVSLTNQAYVDSEMFIEIHLVHSELTLEANSNTTLASLIDITNGSGALSGAEALRNEKGADFVVLLKDFDYPTHTACGRAWLLGDTSTGSMPNSYRSHAYGVVLDGSSGGYYCSEFTFTHELGHNFGFHHDIDHATGSGLFPYSFGHDIPGMFATIMSYDTPEIARFSNPNILCNGSPCGINGAADNALSGNEVRHDLAAFTARVDAGLPEVSLIGDELSISESGARNGTITVNRTGEVSDSLNVNVAISGTATVGDDYSVSIGSTLPVQLPPQSNYTFTIPAGATSVAINIQPVNDDVDEGTETVILTIVGTVAAQTYTIDDSNNSAQIEIDDGSSQVISGDANGDGDINIQDVVSIINLVLNGESSINGADCNGDGVINIQDVVCAINLILASE